MEDGDQTPSSFLFAIVSPSSAANQNNLGAWAWRGGAAAPPFD